jgi:hypothetical protein
MKLIPGLLVLGFALPLGMLHAALRSQPEDQIVVAGDTGRSRSQIFRDSSPTWYWVYEGLAQGQSFVATGTDVETLRLRVAQLNDATPEAPLEVEIRSPNLRVVYVCGSIRPDEPGREFRWIAARLDHRSTLEKGKPYVLLLHSKATRHNTPWLINAVFKDLYPSGRHLGYADDLFFSLSFSSGAELHVGPATTEQATLPTNSGRKGGVPMLTAPALQFGGRSRPAIATHDPLGPIPSAYKISGEGLTAP